MKAMKLNIKREIKAATAIETTHANLNKKENNDIEKSDLSILKKVKKTKTKSIKFSEEEVKKIDEFLEKNQITFSSLINYLLKKENIL